ASRTGPVWNFTTEIIPGSDVTPPEIVGIQIVEPNEVVIDFSEPIDSSLINNLQNYTISNSISALNAELNETQERLFLTTSNHDSNFVYVIEVNNLTDTAGNMISNSANSVFYKLLGIGQYTYQNFLMESVAASATTDTNTSPQKTLDGLINGDPDPFSRWAAQTFPQWIEYDLGSLKNITLIAISFYYWNQGRIYQYSVQISEDRIQWDEIISNQSSANQEWTLNQIQQGTYARYVRVICVSSNQSDWACIWETRILGPSQIPVELISFSGQVNHLNQVELNWVTATETNNLSFEIERKNSENDYQVIGSIPGSGTSSEPRHYNFIDKEITPGIYKYRLKQNDLNGHFDYSPEIEVEVPLPVEFALYQNYPNPFNPLTKIDFSLPVKQTISLVIYNSLGQVVRNLFNDEKQAGIHSITFNASGLPSGVYFYTIRGENIAETKKMILTK
ncbi:MAG TPA: discoidin domain-containing protein, partial [Ignavibacteriaceae bacterium]